MIYNQIQDLKCSNLGIGLMRHNENDFQTTQNIIDCAISNGINYFESCIFYLDFHCEEILARALQKYKREDYKLCGKICLNNEVTSRRYKETFFNQLEKNKTDYFDVYLIQALDRNSMNKLAPELLKFFNQMRAEGKIKKLGFSFHDEPEIFKAILEKNDWDCVQLQLNYYDWFLSHGQELYRICEDGKMPIIAMGGLKGGTLTKNLPKQAKNLIQKYGEYSPLEYGLRFLSSLPLVKVVLCGANNIPQLKENIDFFHRQEKVKLQMDDFLIYKSVIEVFKQTSRINCTECLYCKPQCPMDIKIPEIFSLYNSLLDSKEKISDYVAIQKSKQGSFSCIECGQCEEVCPQHLPIRELFNTKIFTFRM